MTCLLARGWDNQPLTKPQRSNQFPMDIQGPPHIFFLFKKLFQLDSCHNSEEKSIATSVSGGL